MRDGMVSFLSIIALGFFLGMRHATDADTSLPDDHRQPRTHDSQLRADWNPLGPRPYHHYFYRGFAYYSVRRRDPARLGLTMELSVGLMLILLGILNLSGMMNWIARNFAGGHGHSHSHEGEGGHSHSPVAENRDCDAASLGWMDRAFGRIGLYSVASSARGWRRSRPRWFRCDCSSRTQHDSVRLVPIPIPAGSGSTVPELDRGEYEKSNRSGTSEAVNDANHERTKQLIKSDAAKRAVHPAEGCRVAVAVFCNG